MSIFDKLNRNDVERTFNKVVKNKNDLIRKTKKLRRDPELFFKDMYAKRTRQLISKIPVKYEGQHQFTVVSAVYNVEKYLDEYFSSLVNQSLDFKKHIQLILVDDGSTDSSAKIIKKWQKKYPNNIHYYYKENGGQASARDYGLDYIKTEWCTFIDPDDFVDNDYFRVIDEAIQSEKDLWMVSCNLIYYYEQSKQYKDNHPQNYKFRQKISFFDVKDQYQYIQLSVSLAILNTKIIQENGLRFDTRIKPSFEDATFMMNYALALHKKQGRVAFVKDAKYYYRKRENGTSTLDTGWIKPTGYDEVLRYGCLQTLKNYHESLGYVPRFIQNSVMYYHIWQIKGIVNQDNAVDFLTTEQKTEYLSLLRQIFEYIDEEAIDGFNLAGTWMFEKAGMLNLYKNQSPRKDLQIGYIEKYDATKDEILLYYFAPEGSMAAFYDNDTLIQPSHKKILRHSFLDEAFIYEYRYWVPLSEIGNITLEVDGSPTKISFAGRHIRTPIEAQDIRQYFQAQYRYPNVNDVWIIMDRDVQADDNAEHFYRYVMNNHPEQKIYFALRKSSHDWARLEAEGFNLLDFGSVRFETELKNCSKIISSHIDNYIVDYFGDKGLLAKDFVFLPHGVTQNDLYSWYNSKIQYMSLMAVATYDEYDSIAGDNNHYKYSKKEIKLTGFPRHDALLKGNVANTKRIVVMPTWRKYLLGSHDKQTGQFLKNPKFMQSEYAQKWQSFLASAELQRLIREHGYEVVFAPHKNTEAYLDEFNIPSNIKIWRANPDESIQKLFQTADLMITDYSSVAFEMGYLGKTVLYYQFDFEEFFAEQWQRGYFEYETHGFGAVSTDEDKLLSDLAAVLANDGRALPEYQKRIDDTFAHRDDKNCERVYQEILVLDNTQSQPSIMTDDFVQQMLSYAHTYRSWPVLERVLTKQASETFQPELYQALYMQGKYQTLFELLAQETTDEQTRNHWQALIDFWLQDYAGISEYFTNNQTQNVHNVIIGLLAHAYLQDRLKFDVTKELLASYSLSAGELVIVAISQAILEQDQERIVELVETTIRDEIWTKDEMCLYKPNLLAARALIALELYDRGYRHIRLHSAITDKDYAAHLLNAQLDYAQGSYQYSIDHFQILKDMGVSLPIPDNLCYIKSLCKTRSLAKLAEEITNDSNLLHLICSDNELLTLWIDVQLSQKNWSEIIRIDSMLKQEWRTQFLHPVILAYYRLGRIEEAYQLLQKPTVDHSYDYWKLVAEIALLMEDKELAKHCYRGMIAIYPDQEKQANLEILANFK